MSIASHGINVFRSLSQDRTLKPARGLTKVAAYVVRGETGAYADHVLDQSMTIKAVPDQRYGAGSQQLDVKSDSRRHQSMAVDQLQHFIECEHALSCELRPVPAPGVECLDLGERHPCYLT